jgi:hypothetical protein
MFGYPASPARRRSPRLFGYRLSEWVNIDQFRYMDSRTLPETLSTEAQRVARRTGLSLPETIEQSHRLGLAIYRERLNRDSRSNPKLYNVFQISFATGLTVEEVGWHCIELGLPILVEQLCVEPLTGLRPFSEEESRSCFEVAHPDFDAVAAHCALLPVPIPPI